MTPSPWVVEETFYPSILQTPFRIPSWYFLLFFLWCALLGCRSITHLSFSLVFGPIFLWSFFFVALWYWFWCKPAKNTTTVKCLLVVKGSSPINQKKSLFPSLCLRSLPLKGGCNASPIPMHSRAKENQIILFLYTKEFLIIFNLKYLQ